VTAHVAAAPAGGPERTAVGRVQEALVGLRHVDRVETLIEKAVTAACAGCDLDRAMLFRVEGSSLVAEAVHVSGDRGAARRELDEARRVPLVLEHVLIETEIVRRRKPTVVRTPQDAPGTVSGLLERMGSRAYVAAPIMPEGRVLGLLLGDRSRGGRDVDDLDRDLLWTFAEGVGHALHRLVLQERLEAQRAQLERMMQTTAELARTACDAHVTLAPAASDTVVALRVPQARADRLLSLLTPRELEVLELVAEGETNAGIARRLVISEGTVKSHVKSLLRKLHVAKRAEAVSRYHRISAVAIAAGAT